MLRFTDGVTIDTSGEYRTTRRYDGLYVVGGGLSIPVNDAKEAETIIKDLKAKANEKRDIS